MAKYGREGHRGRIKQAYLEHGAENMSGVHLVELFLALLIPRKDVKPIAYALFNRFDKIERIFTASYDELISVDGIGDNTAVAIMLYNDLMKRVENVKCENLLDKNNRIGYAKANLFGKEKYNAIFVSPDGSALDNFQFDTLDLIAKNYILENAVMKNCCAIFVMRYGLQDVTNGDIPFVVQLKSLLNSIGIVFLDYIAVGINGCTSINDTEHFKLLSN